MNEAAESAPVESPSPEVAQETVEAVTPESFNIFETAPAAEEPSVELSENSPAPEEKPSKRKDFLEKMRRDRERRANEIELKKRDIALRNKNQELESLKKQQELLKQSPQQFLKSKGIDPLDFQRRLAEDALSSAIESNDTNAISQTQMEIAKLKDELRKRDDREKQRRQDQQRQAAISKFVSDIKQSYANNSEKYPHVTNSVSPQELAQGMGEHWRNTGEQLTIDEACQRLEATLDKQERDFFNNPKNIEKFQKYHPGIASKQVKGPQATLSSRFKEQPTRRESEEMSLEEIKARFPLFTP